MRKWKKKLLMSESIRGLNLILEATLKRLKNLRIFPFSYKQDSKRKSKLKQGSNEFTQIAGGLPWGNVNKWGRV